MSIPWSASRAAIFQASSPRRGLALATASVSTTTRRLYPDPASRFQPEGPHGPSEVVDPNGYSWSDRGWKGIGLKGQVIYEMHVGTFTPEGTWAAAVGKLPFLKDIGVTADRDDAGQRVPGPLRLGL